MLSDALSIASAAARAGGEVLRSRGTGKVRSKGWKTDFVTEADLASGVAVARAILAADPAARILVEEPEVAEMVGFEPGTLDDPEVWVVDPLDGTTSYLHGYPCYSVAVALLHDGQPVAGAVYNVALDEMNAAASGAGATRDGAPLHVAGATDVQAALMITGFPYDRGAPLDKQLAVLAAFLRAPVHGIRRDGSAAIDLCHVAAGRADGFWEYTLLPWDMAAGVLICREAGALVTDIDGREWSSASSSVCVANPVLQPKMLELIAGA